MSDLNIPEQFNEAKKEVTPNINVKILTQGQGLPTNISEGRAIIIDQFGLSKLALNTYLRGVDFAKSKLEKSNKTDYNGKVPVAQRQDFPLSTSALGTPLWDYLIIRGGTYTDRLRGQITYPDIRIETVLINITQSHNLVLTDIQGRDDEVIEYTGKKSFRINFKGGIFGNNNNRPKNEIADFVNMINSNKPIKIRFCGFLAEWDISEFYILDKSIPQTMGGYNYQLFDFNAINSVPVILASKQTL
ncbi:MAG TPA: DUF6046 domain-containing protein [Bacteroidia bacterium]|nr:DUF6046 domain-containing protein [Bacteroidia bacterium]